MWVSEDDRLSERLELRVDPKTLAALKAAAARERRPISFVVREALAAWLVTHPGGSGSPPTATLNP